MRSLTAALWAAFAVALLIGAADFLLACGFSIGGRLWSYCPAPVGRAAIVAEAQRGERLQRLIHAAEMTLAEKPACAAPPTHRADTEQTMRKSYDRGAKRGMLEVFLAWKTLDDLDLVVFCPGGGSIGGAINHSGTCGDGAIDLDANQSLSNNVSTTPTEHAVWGHSIPEGDYRIGAYVYKTVDPRRGRTISFTMIFKLGDEERVCDGAVRYAPRDEGVTTPDGRPAIARDLAVDWTYGASLPTCDWREHLDPYCGDVACQSR